MVTNRAHILKQILSVAFDFIFPNLCLVCGRWIPSTNNDDKDKIISVNILCKNCERLLIKRDSCKNVCAICGKESAPQRSHNHLADVLCQKTSDLFSKVAEPQKEYTAQNLCPICRNKLLKGNPPAFKAARTAIFYNETARQLIHRLKYSMAPRIGVYFGRYLAEAFSDFYEARDADIIIPVPLYWLRQIRRGYNQSEILAAELARRTKIKYDPNILKRRKSTTHQARLGRGERLKNVTDVFVVIKPHKIKGKKILLVDDVMTTGATFDGCATALIKAGAQEVYCLAVAGG